MIVVEKLLKHSAISYRKHKVSSDGCISTSLQISEIKHYLHILIEKSIIERTDNI